MSFVLPPDGTALPVPSAPGTELPPGAGTPQPFLPPPDPAQAICFAEGTLIATKSGPVAVQNLRPGQKLQTADNGYRRLRWVGQWTVAGLGPNAPVRIAPGVFGNDRMLEVSALHRLVIRPQEGVLRGEELLVPAQELLGLPGVTRAPRIRVRWFHLLCDEHEVLFAEGARAESLLPEPDLVTRLAPDQQQAMAQAIGAPPEPGLPARALLPPGRLRRIWRHHSAARTLGFAD